MDTEGPFTDFFDSAKPAVEDATAETPKPKKERKKRTTREKPAAVASPPETPIAPMRRGPKPGTKRQPVAGSSKVDLGVAIEALAGLPPEDAKIVARLANGLQQLSKKARTRIVAALGRLFA